MAALAHQSVATMMPIEVFAVGAFVLGAIVLVWQFLHWYDEDAAWVRTCGWCDDRVEGKGATPLVPVWRRMLAPRRQQGAEIVTDTVTAHGIDTYDLERNFTDPSMWMLRVRCRCGFFQFTAVTHVAISEMGASWVVNLIIEKHVETERALSEHRG